LFEVVRDRVTGILGVEKSKKERFADLRSDINRATCQQGGTLLPTAYDLLPAFIDFPSQFAEICTALTFAVVTVVYRPARALLRPSIHTTSAKVNRILLG
jgi:hypothetical protein